MLLSSCINSCRIPLAAGAVQLQRACQRQYSSQGGNSHLLSMEIFVSPMWDGPNAFCAYCVLGLEVSQEAFVFVTSQLSLQMQAYLENSPFRFGFSLFILQSYKLDMFPLLSSHIYQGKTLGFWHVVVVVKFYQKYTNSLKCGDDVKNCRSTPLSRSVSMVLQSPFPI